MWSLIPWKKNSGNSGTLSVEPFERDLNRIRQEFDSLLTRLWSGFPGFSDELEGRFGWGLDVDEDATHYIARVPAPGFEVEDFDIHVSGNHLVVKAEHKETEEGKNGRSSFRYGRVQRMIPLPDGAETDQIDAKYRNGVLELKIPKGKQAETKRIAVKSG
jgi:HSP20 family protein